MKKISTLLLLLFFSSKLAFCQLEKMQAYFIFNFIRQIDWSANTKKNSTFTVAMLGNNQTALTELKKVLDNQHIGDQVISVVNPQTLGDVSKCNLLFIPKNETTHFPSSLAKFKGQNTLIITDGKDLARKGACINFTLINNKISFEINQASFRTQGLQVSSSLTKLASLVVN